MQSDGKIIAHVSPDGHSTNKVKATTANIGSAPVVDLKPKIGVASCMHTMGFSVTNEKESTNMPNHECHVTKRHYVENWGEYSQYEPN